MVRRDTVVDRKMAAKPPVQPKDLTFARPAQAPAEFADISLEEISAHVDDAVKPLEEAPPADADPVALAVHLIKHS